MYRWLTILVFLSSTAGALEVERSIWSDTLFVDGKEYRTGFWSGMYHDQSLFSKDEKARDLFVRSQQNQYYAKWCAWGGVAAAIGYLVTRDRKLVKEDGRLVYKLGYDSATYWGLFAAGFVPAIVLSVISRSQVDEAIEIYKKKFPEGNSLALQVIPKSNESEWGLGVGLEF